MADGAEIAVMGAAGAVQILHGQRLAAIDDAGRAIAEQRRSSHEYEDRFVEPVRRPPSAATSTTSSPPPTPGASSPHALERLATKREHACRSRRHSNTPL